MTAVDEHWHAWRSGADLPDRCAVTATAVAKAASGRYGGAYAVVAEHLGIVEKPEQNAAMERGQRLEPVITTAAEVLTGLHIVGEQQWCQHPERAELRATVDGFASDLPAPTIAECSHVVEIKTRGVDVRPAWDYWNAQVQWQLLVTGLPQAMLVEAAYDDAAERVASVRIHLIDRDDLTMIGLLDIADTLLAHMRSGTLPDPDGNALETVKHVMAVVDPDAEVVDLTEMAGDVARLAELKAAGKVIDDESRTLEARIRNAVGAATKGVCDGYELTISRPRRTLTKDGAAALLAERPDLAKTVVDTDLAKNIAKDAYEAHLTATGARALTIKETS